MSVLIKGGRVIDPARGVDQKADVLIEDGRISRVEPGIGGADQVFKARDRLVIPGMVDLHTHLREPGQEYKEDIDSGTRAGAAGGFTTLCCMPNTDPVNDTRSVTEFITKRAAEVDRIQVHPIGAISRGLKGEALCEYADMKKAGIVAVSDDGRCVMDAGMMRRVLEYAATFDLPVVQHCEDHHLSQGGAMNEGANSTIAGLSAQPPAAESIIVGRDVELLSLTGGRYHVAHISTRSSLDHVRRAKQRGLPITCEVAPHHFTLTDEACRGYDTATKVNPPLRSEEDRQALLEAIADGTVDAIATDHAPHSTLEKELEYGLAAFGISGLETALPLSLDLWRDGVITLKRLVELMTCGPAKVFGLGAGTLSVGRPGDVTVVDPDIEWTVDPRRFRSKGRNTPFAGRTVRGAAVLTLARGKVVFEQ